MCGNSTIPVCLIQILLFQLSDHSFMFTVQIQDSSPEKSRELLVIIIVPIVVFLITLVPVVIIAIRISIMKCCKKKGMNMILSNVTLAMSFQRTDLKN